MPDKKDDIGSILSDSSMAMLLLIPLVSTFVVFSDDYSSFATRFQKARWDFYSDMKTERWEERTGCRKGSIQKCYPRDGSNDSSPPS